MTSISRNGRFFRYWQWLFKSRCPNSLYSKRTVLEQAGCTALHRASSQRQSRRHREAESWYTSLQWVFCLWMNSEWVCLQRRHMAHTHTSSIPVSILLALVVSANIVVSTDFWHTWLWAWWYEISDTQYNCTNTNSLLMTTSKGENIEQSALGILYNVKYH